MLSTSGSGIPLPGALLIVWAPPAALTAWRLPVALRRRRERLEARAAARAADRPAGRVVTARRQRVVRTRSRAQRRSGRARSSSV
ncbi:hypothetical protein [Streptomyces sp. NPDC047108]|uniref:hypothetical protein n=1 Tax=Streptomyces sp. NPDC047108 TaxID=3155025 RepID=UPI0033F95422